METTKRTVGGLTFVALVLVSCPVFTPPPWRAIVLDRIPSPSMATSYTRVCEALVIIVLALTQPDMLLCWEVVR